MTHSTSESMLAEPIRRKCVNRISMVHLLALYRLGGKVAMKFLRQAEERTTFLTPTDFHYRTAIERLSRYTDQSLSLADTVVGVFADRLRLPVWTYDHHFDIMRVSVWRP